jgi:hypothetical protein
MANGYLGKISAVVSANTSDFQSKLNGAAKDVQKFASSMQSSLTSAQTKATASLRGIYTEAQKLERALQAASTGKLSFKGFAGPDLASAVGRMRAFASVTKEIGGPLTAATKSFNQLSMEVQGEFSPALRQAQVLTERLADTINKTGTVSEERFQRVAGAVSVAVDSMKRLSEASKLVGGLATGKELRFSNPQFVAEATRSQRLQQEAAALSPSSISAGGIGGLVAQISAAAKEAERLNAALENESQLVNGNVPAATAKLTAQLAVWRSLNEELERRNEVAQKAALVGTGKKAAENETAALVYRERAEKELEARRVAAAQKVAENETAALVYRERAEKELEARRVAAAQKVADSEMAALINRERAAKESEARKSAPARAAAQNFGTPFARVFEAAQIDSYKSKLRLLQEILIGAGVSAGVAADEVNNFAAALQNASSKEGGLKANAAVIATSQDAAVAAVAAAVPNAGGVKGINRRLARVGDVGRGGIDKFSLGLNQAAFAIDDFMSSTGGVEQKLRAVSNNITQLGFIVGGTAGLFTSLGAVIAGQAAVALMKWINNGVDAEHKTKALNDALTRQKSLLEELKQAFESLGDSLSRSAFSAAGQKAREFSREIDEIKKKQQEQRDGAVTGASPAVQRERAFQASRAAALEGETDVGRRISLQKEIDESKQRERVAKAAAIRAAATSPAPDKESLIATIQSTIPRSVAGIGGPGGMASTAAAAVEQERRRAQARRDVEAAGAALNVPQLEQLAKRYPAAAAAIDEMIKRLTLDAATKFDNMTTVLLESAGKVAHGLESANAELQDAIRAGIPGARRLRAVADGVGDSLEKALKAVRAANEMPQSTAAERSARESALQRAQGQMEDAQAAQQDLLRNTNEVRRVRTLDPQATAEARMDAARSGLSAAGLGSGRLARRLREIEFAQGSINAASDVNNNPESARRFQMVEAALKREVQEINAAALALRQFSEAVQQSSQQLKSNVSSAEQASQEARRNDLARSTPETRAARAQAEQDERQARRLARRAQDEIDNMMAQREESMLTGPNAPAFRRMSEINQSLESGSLSAAQQRQLREERSRLQDQVQPEIDAQEQAARAAVTASTREEERRRSAERGRELAKTPAQKAADEAARGLADIVQARNAGLIPRGQANEAASRFGREQLEQAAPMIASMAEEVQNAILQGPSRAALEVSDVSTTQGQRELSRLLRGDDSAKNANIVELEKQNQKLVEVVNVLKDIARANGIVLDL